MLEQLVDKDIRHVLSLEELEERYREDKLGKMYLPNGVCTKNDRHVIESFLEYNFLRNDLHEMCRMITGHNNGYIDKSITKDIMGIAVVGNSLKKNLYIKSDNDDSTKKNSSDSKKKKGLGKKLTSILEEQFVEPLKHYFKEDLPKTPFHPRYSTIIVLCQDNSADEEYTVAPSILTLHGKGTGHSELIYDGGMHVKFLGVRKAFDRLKESPLFYKQVADAVIIASNGEQFMDKYSMIKKAQQKNNGNDHSSKKERKAYWQICDYLIGETSQQKLYCIVK